MRLRLVLGFIVIVGTLASCKPPPAPSALQGNGQTPGGSRPMEVIGHRGASAVEPENTMAAFRHAMALNAQAIEFDVHKTSDGHIVVIHDTTVDRTTNGTGSIAEMTLNQVRVLDAGGGQKVPTFDEVMQLVKEQRLPFYFEVKSPKLYAGVVDKAIETLRQFQVMDLAVMESFDDDALVKARALEPKLRLLKLCKVYEFPDFAAIPANAEYVGVALDVLAVRSDLIAKSVEHGVKLIGWDWQLQNKLYTAYKPIEFIKQLFGSDSKNIYQDFERKGLAGVMVNDISFVQKALAE